MPPHDNQNPRMTTIASASVSDNQNSLATGERGPVLMQNWQLIEKLAHQNRERILERVVHAKGGGAHGTLRITGDISHLTCASVLQLGAETAMIARFSTVAGETGAADHERDVRGFSTTCSTLMPIRNRTDSGGRRTTLVHRTAATVGMARRSFRPSGRQ